jgi:hypothetical protein
MLKMMLRMEDRGWVGGSPLLAPGLRSCDAHLAPTVWLRARRPTTRWPHRFREPVSRVDLAVRGRTGRIAGETDCVQSTIRYTQPDESGILRPVTPSPVKMVAREKDWYCAHDWSREKEALLRRYRGK